MQIAWSTDTKADFRRFHEFLNPKNTTAALKAVRTIREKVGLLADNPEIGTSLDDGSQRRELYIKFGSSGYVVSYVTDYDDDMINILRIWHSREERD